MIPVGNLTDNQNIVTPYSSFSGCSMLNNPLSDRLFFHFRYSLAPFISIFERYTNDSVVSHAGSVPTIVKGLWADILPIMALEHPALLRTMLAISSLNISIMHKQPPSLTLKEYHYALRKVRFALGLPLRRRHISTLAATLLLASYEVMSADHPRWTNHLTGAAQLIREIDFAGMTRDLRTQRRRVLTQRKHILQAYRQPEHGLSISSIASEDDPFADQESEIDEDLIGCLLDRAVDYDMVDQPYDPSSQTPRSFYSQKDIEAHRIQCDLYWLFIKNDLIKSILSGMEPLYVSFTTPFDGNNAGSNHDGVGYLMNCGANAHLAQVSAG